MILITGGAGFVGSALIKYLITQKLGQSIIVVDSLLYRNDYFEDIKFYNGDVSNEKFMENIFSTEHIDTVIHLAGIVGDAACQLKPLEAYAANIKSCIWLRDNFNGRIIFPSSCSVYGEQINMATEDSILKPLSTYAIHKVEAEKCFQDKNAIFLRLGTLHGVSNRFRNDLVVNTLAIKALIDSKITVFGGNQYRPLLHVDDLTYIIAACINNNLIGPYNTIQDNYNILDIANEVKNYLTMKNIYVDINITESVFEDKRNYRANGSKLYKAINFVPSKGIKDTMIDIYKLYTQGRIKDFNNKKYSNYSSLVG